MAAGAAGRDKSGLLRDLPAKIEEEELSAAMAHLESEGQVVRLGPRLVLPRFTDLIVGRVQRLSAGDALLLTGADFEAGYFLSRRDLRGALAGDLVLARPKRGRRPRGGKLPEAAVVRVVGRPRRTFVGTLEVDDEGNRWLCPFDPDLDLELEVEGGENLTGDQYVVVGLEEGEVERGSARGRVLELLGSLATPGVDTLVVLRHHGIPEQFSASVEGQAESLPENPHPAEILDREDLRAELAVTIDGETARDFDDAISVSCLPGGRFRLGVHIADVSHYVEEGSELDLEAYHRGTSVYFPERAVAMLPERLSNGLCSLRPGVPRLTVSAFLEIGSGGQIEARRFAPSVIASARRLTYEEVRRLLEEPRPDDRGRYGESLLVMLEAARDLALQLHDARLERGSLDFDLPEGDVILDTDGRTVGIRPEARTVAHRLIEEFMLAANEAVAREFFRHDCPALHRVHDAPDRLRLEELRELLRGFGLDLRGDLANLHPSVLQEVLERCAGRPEEALVSALVLRAQRRALYSTEGRGHYALAARHYTHFTSPIRRYPDLLVHRRLKALLAGRAVAEAERTALELRLPGIASHASFTERRAEHAERDLLQWKKVRFLATRVGERFTARLTGVQPFGLFAELENLYVDGLIPISTLSDDFYRFEPDAHRLVGERSGRVFRLADRVEVKLVGVDHRHRGLDLRLLLPQGRPRGQERAPRRSPAKRRRRIGH